jgi:hypothetical protein
MTERPRLAGVVSAEAARNVAGDAGVEATVFETSQNVDVVHESVGDRLVPGRARRATTPAPLRIEFSRGR